MPVYDMSGLLFRRLGIFYCFWRHRAVNYEARILVFIGDGKGKTTAALGMAVRAVGHSMRTLILQFVKNKPSGELEAIKQLPGIEIIQCGLGFLPEKNSSEFAVHKKAAQGGWRIGEKAILSGDYKLVILDEIFHAVSWGLLDEQKIIAVLKKAKAEMCIVLTGRDAANVFVELADTVTEMNCIKHAFEVGKKAQEGIEF